MGYQQVSILAYIFAMAIIMRYDHQYGDLRFCNDFRIIKLVWFDALGQDVLAFEVPPHSLDDAQ